MTIRRIAAGLAGLATCAAAMAQGSLNFDTIPGIDQQPSVTVDVTPTMIAFWRGMFDDADPATPDIFAGLRNIRLRVYDVTDSGRAFGTFIQDVAGRLEGQGWQRVASVMGEGSNVQLHMQMTEENVTGMTIMVLDGEEAIFMTIDGSISAADLGRLMRQLNIPEVMEAMGPMSFPESPPPAPGEGN